MRWMLGLLVVTQVAAAELGGPLDGISLDELARFQAGRIAFEAEEDVDEGLGPVFNGTSCVACHSVGGTGGGSEAIETRAGTAATATSAFLAPRGGTLIQSNGIGLVEACPYDYVAEDIPDAADVVAGRRATALFGAGLVEAIPDDVLVALAAKTGGRAHLVTDVGSGQQRVGRFGWKAQQATLLAFSADAYLNEMGVTTPLFPDESCPNGDCALVAACDPVPGVDDDLDDVEAFRDFMAFLAPVPPDGHDAKGRRVFKKLGCAGCHVPQVGEAKAFSDFALHDMGSLGDGIPQGDAHETEMRTAPLWGLRLLTTFLHDGRARSIEEAILAHDGQARKARDRFDALGDRSTAAVLRFLGTL